MLKGRLLPLARVYGEGSEKKAELGEDPFPRGVVKIHGEDNTYRSRVGDYRVLYEVYHRQHTILVVKIEHRSTVYGY